MYCLQNIRETSISCVKYVKGKTHGAWTYLFTTPTTV